MQVELPPRVPVDTDAGLLFFQPDDKVITPAVQTTARWEPEEADLLEALLRKRPGWFLDLGAHVGYHSARLLHRGLTTGVMAVEANPETFLLLETNLSRKGFATPDRPVCMVPMVAWHERAQLTLFQGSEGNGGDWRVSREGSGGPGSVAARRVDEAVRAVRRTRRSDGHDFTVSVVKSDLQGRDHLALIGLDETIGTDRPDIVCEFDPVMITEAGASPTNVLAMYESWGYVLRYPDGTESYAERVLHDAVRAPGGALTLWMVPRERAE